MLSHIKPYLHFLPRVAGALCMLLVLCFAISSYFDKQLSEDLYKAYQKENLYNHEAQNYRDFIARRFAIERKGSEAYLSHIEDLLAQNDQQTLAFEILNSRSFFPHLVVDGVFFITPKAYEHWRQVRENTINPMLEKLSANEYGLKPESYRLADFLTYTFIDQSVLLFIANLILLLIVGAYLEFYFGKAGFLMLWCFSSVAYGSIYVLLHDVSHPVLVGASGSVTLLVGIAVAKLLGDWQKDNIVQSALQTRLKWLLFSLILLIGLKLGLEFIFTSNLSWRFLVCQVTIYLMGLGLFFLIKPMMTKTPEKTEQELTDKIDRMRRVEWAKAMDEISSLDFAQAQKRLEGLVEEHPYDPDLVGQLYRLAKLDGTSETYWNCARVLIDTAVEKNNHELAALLFNDIQRNAASKKLARERLQPTHYHKMMMIFVYHGDMENAEKSFLFLELAGHADIIKDACLLLMQEYKHRRNLVKSRQYEMLLERF